MKNLQNTKWGLLGTAAVGMLLSFGAVLSVSAKTTMVTCRAELDREILPVGEGNTAVIKITLDSLKPVNPTERPPVNLSIVLDRSGSMSGQKLEKAKEAAIEALRRLNADDIFSLVIYDHNVETIVSAQRAANTEWIESRIRQIRPGGNTALFGGVSQGAAEIRKHLEGKYVHRIILLSDGLANVGPGSPADLGRLGAGLIKEGISVTTVGVGTDYNEDLMARLSQKSDGNTYFVEDSRDLARIFSAELGDVLSVVAKKVKLIIECADGVEPVNIIGREGRISGRTVAIYLNQIYGGQEKFALIEVKLPEAKHGESRDIAYARVSYEDAITQKEASSSACAVGRFSNDKKKVEESENTGVRKVYVINLNAEAQDRAIGLADEGKDAEAAAVLKNSASKLQSIGNKYNDKDLLQRAEDIKDQAEMIEKEGMSDKNRKVMRADQYQIINQQQSK